MRFSSFPFVSCLTAALLLGCPSGDDGPAAADGSSSSTGSTSAAPTTGPGSSGTSADASTATSNADGSTSSTDETGSVPDAAECPDYATLPLEALLEATPGNAVMDGEMQPVLDVEFGDVDDTLSIIAVLGEDTFVVLPLDEAGEGPAGTVLLIDGDEVYKGRAAVEYQEATDAVLLQATTLTLAGADTTLELSACFHIGSGSSKIEFEGTEATISGALGSLTFTQIQRLQAEHPEIDRLVLQDVPGSINDEVNVETGRLVRNGGWSTHVPADGEIASGGVDLFCAGVERTLEDGARVGVHSWSNGEEEGGDLPMDSPEHTFFIEYLDEMLGSPRGETFYFFTLQAAPAADIHWMTPQEIEQYELLTP